MRAGRLQTRRYRIRKKRRRALLMIFTLGVGMAVALRLDAFSLPRWLPLPPQAIQENPSGQLESREWTLPAGSWHALSLGDFSDAAGADQLSSAYQGRGAGGYILKETEYHVLAAAYTSRADAQQVQRRLSSQYGIDTAQREIAWPEIRLRLTGRESQLTAVENGLNALLSLPEQLYAVSCGLDRQTMDASAARAALLSYRDTLNALENRLDESFSSPPGHIAALRAALSSLYSGLDAAQASSGGAKLGGQVKYCHLMALCLIQELAETMANGN